MQIKQVAAFVLGLLFLPTVGCTAGVGVGGLNIPQDARATCADVCTKVSMSLDAIVAMAGNVGCVCVDRQGTTSESEKAASAAGGMATILITQQQQQAQHTAAPVTFAH
jgi:hypothetical protein